MYKFYKFSFFWIFLVCCFSLSAQIQSITLKPIDNDDDAEERVSTGAVTLSSSDLELGGFDGANQQIVGIRFPNVALPVGASITNAYIQFEVDETEDLPANITISAQQGNAAIYTTANSNISSRDYTGSSVLWNAPAWTSAGDRGVDQRTADLSGIITEAISSGFNSGDALAFRFSSDDDLGKTAAESRNSGEAKAPELVIEYSEQPIPVILLEDILVVNEVTGTGTPENGNDWVELYNTSNVAINLEGVSITDDVNDPTKFTFGQRNINGGSFVLVETDDFFGIKSEGETIYLYQTFNGETVLLDSLEAKDTSSGTSYGRKPNGSNSIADFLVSTPGSSNNSAQEFIDLQFSSPRGLYRRSIQLTLTAPQGSTIRYTLDSDIPSRTEGTIYNGSININSNTVVKAFAYSATGESKMITNTYIISTNSAYEEIPIVIISTTSSTSTTSVNDCTFEFINKYGENDSAYNGAGYKVFGNVSKNERKKNYRVLFKEEYGDNKFRHIYL